MNKRITAAALCAAMMVSGSACVYAADGAAYDSSAAVSAQSGSVYALAASFKDVPAGSWFEPAVKYVTEKGLFSGTGNDMFSPNVNMSRGMFVTVLGRAAGAVVTDTNTGFADVSADKYYAPYIKWAADNGIVTGVGNGKFAPDADVDREQMCAIIVRYLRDYKKIDLSKYETGSADFSDVSAISTWALADVNTAQKLGFVQGSQVGGAVVFDPKGKTTRAAAAAVFMRLDQSMEKLQKGEVLTPESGAAGGSAGGAAGKDDNNYTEEQIQEEKEVAVYLSNISSNYEKSVYVTKVSKNVKDSMDLLINTINKVLADRQGGKFISSEYVKTAYAKEVSQFRDMYKSLTESENNEIQNLVIELETEAHIYVVLDYFGVKQADL